jgi:hypothetical protein
MERANNNYHALVRIVFDAIPLSRDRAPATGIGTDQTLNILDIQ